MSMSNGNAMLLVDKAEKISRRGMINELKQFQRFERQSNRLLREATLDVYGSLDYLSHSAYRNWDVVDEDISLGSTIPPIGKYKLKRGEEIPVYENEYQLWTYQARSRVLTYFNEFALCGIENRVNYIVGEGLSIKAKPYDPTNSKARRLAERCQEFVDLINDINDLSEIEAESAQRNDEDGESFIRIFPDDNGLSYFEFIEPEHIRPRMGSSWGAKYSFGIETLPHNVTIPINYWVVENPTESWESVPVEACDVVHMKYNVKRNSKRGLPTYFPVEGNFRRCEDLLHSMTAMAKTRAKIALLVKMTGVTNAAAQALVDKMTKIRVTDPQLLSTLDLEKIPYGSIIRYPGAQEYNFPSHNVGASDFVEVLQAELRAIASRLQMPEWMFTALADAKYSNAFVVEAPTLKAFKKKQKYICNSFGNYKYGHRRSLMWRAIKIAIDHGLLDPETPKYVDIECTGPSLETRDKQQEATTNKTYNEMGVKSKKTIRNELSLDDEIEENNFIGENVKDDIEKAKETFTQIMQVQTAVYANQMPRDAGLGLLKFVGVDEESINDLLPEQPQPQPQQQLPGQQQQQQQQLPEQQQQQQIPESTTEPSETGDTTEFNLDSAVQSFWDDIGIDNEQLSEQYSTGTIRLLEKGFTGTITDKLGRKIKYVDGKRVSTEKPEEGKDDIVGGFKGAAKDITENWHKAVEDSIRKTGDVPGPEKTSLVGQAWKLVKAKGFDKQPGGIEKFLAALKDVGSSPKGNTPEGFKNALNKHFGGQQAQQITNKLPDNIPVAKQLPVAKRVVTGNKLTTATPIVTPVVKKKLQKVKKVAPTKAKKILSLLGKLYKEVNPKHAKKVKKAYKNAVDKYGPGLAKMVVATALVGINTEGIAKFADDTRQGIYAIAKFFSELGERSKKAIQAFTEQHEVLILEQYTKTIHFELLEAGFTGTVRDSRGRVFYYENGKRVKNPHGKDKEVDTRHHKKELVPDIQKKAELAIDAGLLSKLTNEHMVDLATGLPTFTVRELKLIAKSFKQKVKGKLKDEIVTSVKKMFPFPTDETNDNKFAYSYDEAKNAFGSIIKAFNNTKDSPDLDKFIEETDNVITQMKVQDFEKLCDELKLDDTSATGIDVLNVLQNEFKTQQEIKEPELAKEHKQQSIQLTENGLALDDSIIRDTPFNLESIFSNDFIEGMRQWQSTLNYDEQIALSKYSDGYYKSMNEWLRGDEYTLKYYADKIPEYKAMMDKLNSAFEKSPILKPPLITYRGITLDPKDRDKLLESVRVAQKTGQKLRIKGFQSSSLSSYSAQTFSSTGPDGLMFEIAVHKGPYLQSVGGKTLTLTQHDHEHEVLLPHNTAYNIVGTKVVKYNYNGSIRERTVVQLEQIPDSHNKDYKTVGSMGGEGKQKPSEIVEQEKTLDSEQKPKYPPAPSKRNHYDNLDSFEVVEE